METALKTDEEKKEFFDTEEELNFKIDQLAEWILESKHFIAFTGAGISTAAGISDYRSGVNTVLAVGPGVWEKKKHKIQEKKTDAKTLMQKAFPTITHMALAQLMNEDYLKFLISQNVDGLHIKSGIDINKISELHGNTNIEKCTKCGKKYFRDYKVRNNPEVHNHKTGRKCLITSCRGELVDTIINFNENLCEEELDKAFDHSAKADLILCLGSSLRVSPASDLPLETLKNGGKIVIVNLQKTPYHDIASLNIHGKIENVIDKLVSKINLQIPKWTISRKISFEYSSVGKELVIEPKNIQDFYFSFIKKLEVKLLNKTFFSSKEPFCFKFNEFVKLSDKIEIKFYFEEHYGEPVLSLSEDFGKIIEKTMIIEYDPSDKKWINTFFIDS